MAFRGRETRDLEEADELVDARNRQIEQRVHVLAIEPGAVLEDLAERAPLLLQPARERARRIELNCVEAGPDPARLRRQLDAKRIAKRMRGVG